MFIEIKVVSHQANPGDDRVDPAVVIYNKGQQ